MDGLTQGLLGGAAGQALLGRKLGNAAGVIAALAGMAPDLDILIRSGADPLLVMEYHRHFTHSLAFIPAGGLIVGLLCWLFVRRSMRFWHAWLAASAGWATHGILDVFTSYGTNLLWPFSHARLAWDWIGIIDLFVTVPLLVGLVLAFRQRRALPAAIGLAAALVYIGFGVVQHSRALDVQQRIARARGHVVQRGRVLPAPLSLSLWRSIYEHDGALYADGLWVAPFESVAHWPGQKVTKVEWTDFTGRLPADSTQARDIERFARFTDGFLYRPPTEPDVLGDFRYAIAPNSTEPLWGIRIDPGHPAQHVQRVNFRRGGLEKAALFLRMLTGRAPGARKMLDRS